MRPAALASTLPSLTLRPLHTPCTPLADHSLQKWFLLEFSGSDAEIDIVHCSHPEFSEWSWQPLADLPAGVVHFKRGVYGQVASQFGPEIARRCAALARA